MPSVASVEDASAASTSHSRGEDVSVGEDSSLRPPKRVISLVEEETGVKDIPDAAVEQRIGTPSLKPQPADKKVPESSGGTAKFDLKPPPPPSQPEEPTPAPGLNKAPPPDTSLMAPTPNSQPYPSQHGKLVHRETSQGSQPGAEYVEPTGPNAEGLDGAQQTIDGNDSVTGQNSTTTTTAAIPLPSNRADVIARVTSRRAQTEEAAKNRARRPGNLSMADAVVVPTTAEGASHNTAEGMPTPGAVAVSGVDDPPPPPPPDANDAASHNQARVSADGNDNEATPGAISVAGSGNPTNTSQAKEDRDRLRLATNMTDVPDTSLPPDANDDDKATPGAISVVGSGNGTTTTATTTSQSKEDRDRLHLATNMTNVPDTSQELSKELEDKDEDAGGSPMAKLGSSTSLMGTSTSPIVAELALNEDELEEKIANRLKTEMEEEVQQQVEKRLEQERELHVVAQAIEVDPTSIQDGDDDDDYDQDEISKAMLFGMPKRCVCLLLFLIVVAAIVGVVVAVVVGKKGDDSPSLRKSSAPTAAPTRYTSPRFDELVEWIGPLVTDEPKLFLKPTKPQYMAMDWLANVDTFVLTEGGTYNITDELTNTNVEYSIDPQQVYVERYALAVLYFATDGVDWKHRCNFTTPAHVCDWADEEENLGVVCTDGGYVSELNLPENTMSGAIPSELALLRNLTLLGLDRNYLFGTVPLEIYSMASLEMLWLEDCALTGTIPTEMGSWTNLLFLDLDMNGLRGSLPTEVGLLTKLTALQMILNNLDSELPTELGLLTNLEAIDLEGNSFEGQIPTELGLLTNLMFLYVENNYFQGPIPTELGLLTSLENLYMDRNELTGTIPAEFGSLVNMTHMYLYANYLTGEVPASLGNLAELDSLFMEANALTGSVDDIFCSSNSSVLNLDELWTDCGIPDDAENGTMPEVICSCCTSCCVDEEPECKEV